MLDAFTQPIKGIFNFALEIDSLPKNCIRQANIHLKFF
jgi:hypothetical protein